MLADSTFRPFHLGALKEFRMSLSTTQRRALIGLAVLLVMIALSTSYLLWLDAGPARPGTPAYEQYVSLFQAGVAALDADVPEAAEQSLDRAVLLIPNEAAGWANLGLLYVRTGRLTDAAKNLERANRLAPNDPEIEKLLGLLAQRLGKFRDAKAYLVKATRKDDSDNRALYLLAQVVEQEHKAGSDSEYLRLLEKILIRQPDNLRILMDRLRKAVSMADSELVADTVQRFNSLSPHWLERTKKEWAAVQLVLSEPLGPSLVPKLQRFDNTLKGERHYVAFVSEVLPTDEMAGTALQSFRWLAPIEHSASPPDTRLEFASNAADVAAQGPWDLIQPVWMNADKPPVIVATNGKALHVGNQPALPAIPVELGGLVAIDWNNDFLTDIVLAGADGLRFLQQHDDGTLVDVTDATKLPADALKLANHSALAADVDLDADLDLLVSSHSGPPRFLRNNFDGTWTARPIFPELDGPQRFSWADFDHDGAPDAAVVDTKGQLRVFSNNRSGQFKPWSAPIPDGDYRAITTADVTDDGVFDIIALRSDGTLVALSDYRKQQRWDTKEIAKWDVLAADKSMKVPLLTTADFDNNGALDLLVSGPQRSAIWLGSGKAHFQLLNMELPPRIMAAADLRDRGHISLLLINQLGQPVELQPQGQFRYYWQTVRPHAKVDADGDNRINSFGIGGDIEIRSGTYVHKLAINSPAVHFGLGRRQRADVIKVQWPNGSTQYEFTPTVNQSIAAHQRLKGSCPFLFAWNGTEFTFVTDFMWSTPLGMYINASDKGGFLQTTDWVKIPGQQLAAQNNRYELRVTANLWETHFFDYLALMSVDHPADTEMFVDERFFMEPTPPKMILTGTPRPVKKATDDAGHDATAAVKANDEIYFDHIRRGRYQGVAKDHWVEIELGADIPQKGPVWLIARGWMHPTDSSVNYALEQGNHVKPQGLVLEVRDGHGGWRVAKDRIGFPSGKNKTILLRLDQIAGETRVPQRFRLRTNLEICWDSLLIAGGRDDSLAKRRLLPAAEAKLGFRGMLAMTQKDRSSPELPHYGQVVSRGQAWRDLIGYHTRYGAIDELLAGIDDRYAIINAGDEVTLRFEAPMPPPTGWKRDFIWIADGWVKDGDYNTRFGKTVLPLPAHDMSSYDTTPGELEDDPVYQRHREDWQTYHTRYVTPHVFEQGLRNFRKP